MPRWYIEALTAAAPIKGKNLTLKKAKPLGVYEEATVEKAAREAVRTGVSVLDLIYGVRVRCYLIGPAEDAHEVWVRYSNPDGEGDGDERLRYYGDVVAVRA